MPATAGIVAQYPVAPYTTPVDGDDLAAALVVSHDNTTATAHVSHDADATIHFQSSTLAARPAAGTAHRKWITSDGLRVYYDTGGAWSEIDYLCKTTGGTVAGDLALGGTLAVTGATTLTGLLTSNKSGLALTFNSAAAATQYAFFGNTGAQNYFGIEGSAGSGVAVGAAAYATVLTTGNATELVFGTNATARARISSGGIFLVGTTVTTNAAAGDIVVPNAKGIRGVSVSGAGTVNLIQFNAANEVVIGTTGNVNTIGAVASTVSAGAGDLVLTNARGIRSVNNAGTDTIRLIDLQLVTNLVCVAGGGGQIILLGSPSSATGAVAGDVILANNRHLRTANNAGTGAKHVIGMTNGDIIYVGLDVVGPIAFGLPASTTSAAAGDTIVAKNTSLRRANNAGTNANRVITFGGNDDWIYFDADAVAGFGFGTTVVTGASAGDLIIRNSRVLRSVNGASTAARALIHMSANDTLWVGGDAVGAIALGAPATTSSAGAGEVVIANNKSVRATNAGATTTYGLIYLDGNDFVQIDTNGRGVLFGTTITTGVGAGDLVVQNAKSLRGVVAANNNTKRLISLSAADKVAIDLDAVGATFGAGAVFAGAVSGITTLGIGGALSGVTSLSMSGALSGATTGNFSGDLTASGNILRANSTRFNTPQQTAGITNVAVTIFTGQANGAAQVWVCGSDGAGNRFIDLVNVLNNQTRQVSSITFIGAPAARTYAVSGNNLTMSIASGTFTVIAVPFEVVLA